ncbi:uncharacterized protein LOC134753679 [Cydia strobilella]|uniref:uncharacterized protein LOC134753679 n=1 Tax=Cydia strobilella TaxID=1100964 RepID=UPI003006EB2F
MGDKILVEQIIETIKQHPVLYDHKVPCRKDLSEALWEEIADTFDLDVQILKVKWKNLRDCYKKHIRAQTDDSKAVSSYKHWQWSKYLEFLRPHIRSNTNTEVVYHTEDTKEYSENILNIKLEEMDHTNFGSDFEATECISKQPTKNKEKHSKHNFGSDSDNLECVIEQPDSKKRRIHSDLNVDHVKTQNNRDVHEFDDIELIFLGYAKTVKKMPLKRQISVKMKIAKIMMEEELKCLE